MNPPLSAAALAFSAATARLCATPWVSPVLLAPMAEITSSPFRRLCRELGAGCAVTEMSKARYVLDPNEDTQRTLAYVEAERPIGAQIVGSDETEIAQAAAALAQRRFDFIDLNLGCSVRRIVFEGCGGALLTDPTLVERLVRTARAASGLPVTVKMRSGPDPQQVTAVEIAQAAQAGGAAAIAIHPRFVSQAYGGDADPAISARVVAAVQIPVAVGGDVFSPQIAVQLMRRTGAAAVQFGRGVIGKPWVIAETLALLRDSTADLAALFTLPQKLTYAWRHLCHMADHYGPDRAALMFRRHALQYAEAIGEPGIQQAFLSGMKRLESVEHAFALFRAAGLPDDAPTYTPSATPPSRGHRPPAVQSLPTAPRSAPENTH